MILNYLKVAARHLTKNKIYLIINVLGMGIAIACAMTAYLLVAYNIEFDAAIDQERVKNIVKVMHHRKQTDGDPYRELVAPLPLAPAVANDIAGIKHYSRFCSTGGYVTHGTRGFYETIFFADSAFMTMFQPRLIAGSYKNFLDKNTIFINEKFATKYFGDGEAVGKDLIVYINNKLVNAVVGGVMKDMPFNSTFTENALMRIEQFVDIYNIRQDDWSGKQTASVLFELNDRSQASSIGIQLQKYVTLRNESLEDARSVRYELLPFNERLSPNDVRQSDLHLLIPSIALVIFGTMGGIILLIACFNLTNTTLALSMKRLKEIGIRKVIGSKRRQVVFQFLIEITVTITVAVMLGFAMSLYLIPEFASMWQLPYGMKELNSLNIVVALLTLLFSTALLAGIYPALFSSGMNPVLLFKGASRTGGTNWFSRTLLVGQFALSIIVLIAGTMFTRNSRYQDNISFGYDKDMLIAAITEDPRDGEALANAIASNPKIEMTAITAHHFAFGNAPGRPAVLNAEKFVASVYDVSPEYFSTVGLELISGRVFGESDSLSVVVDGNFVRRRDLADPLGAKIEIEGRSFSIVGVVTDHLTDLESKNDENYVYRLAKPQDCQLMVVRAEASTLQETKTFIEQEWRKLFPGKPLRVDLHRDVLYLEANAYNHNLGRIFLFLTVLGCVLSVSGLYSMASLNIHRRMKEIGVRKVLGASIANILRLLNIEFAIILLVAGIIGSIGGYFMSDGLLTSLYAQRIEVGPVTVALCGLAIIAIGLLATSVTIFGAAIESPVKTLKSE
jgi:ABC-type antimicrobial peptide transport system permease subunit